MKRKPYISKHRAKWFLFAATISLTVVAVIPTSRNAVLRIVGIGPLIGYYPKIYWVKRLRDQDPGRRSMAVYELCKLKSDAEPLVPDLIEMLKDEDDSIRLGAMDVLASIGPQAKDAVPELIEELQGENWRSRIRAAYALGAIGPDAQAAVPTLRKLQNDKRGPKGFSVDTEAKRAIRRIDPLEPN